MRHCQRRRRAGLPVRVRLPQPLQRLLSARNLGLLLWKALHGGHGAGDLCRAGQVLYSGAFPAGRRPLRAGKSACPPAHAAPHSGKISPKDRVVLHRLPSGGAYVRGITPLLRGHGGNALLHRHPHRRPLHRRGEGHLSPVSGQPQPAHYRHGANKEKRKNRSVEQTAKVICFTAKQEEQSACPSLFYAVYAVFFRASSISSRSD